MQVRLILLSGSRVGDEVQVDGEAILGRSPDCALCLEDGGVSRQHAKVRLEADSIWLEDLGSSNGTKVGGQRVREVRLQDGDVFELGKVKVRVKVAGLAPTAEPPPLQEPLSRPISAPAAAVGFEDLEIEDLGAPAAPPAAASPPIVEVRPKAAPAAQAPKAGPAPKAAPSPKTLVPRVAASRKGGLLAEDLGQQGGLPKLLMVLGAVAVAATVFWLIFEAVR